MSSAPGVDTPRRRYERVAISFLLHDEPHLGGGCPGAAALETTLDLGRPVRHPRQGENGKERLELVIASIVTADASAMLARNAGPA